jgi:hypothetical protein
MRNVIRAKTGLDEKVKEKKTQEKKEEKTEPEIKLEESNVEKAEIAVQDRPILTEKPKPNPDVKWVKKIYISAF